MLSHKLHLISSEVVLKWASNIKSEEEAAGSNDTRPAEEAESDEDDAADQLPDVKLEIRKGYLKSMAQFIQFLEAQEDDSDEDDDDDESDSDSEHD